MMNRFRRLRGPNSYTTELGIDPLSCLPQGGIWLDIGCGNGFAVREAASLRPDLTIVALDLEPGFVAPATPPNALFMQADASALPLTGRRFDLVTAVHVLHFIDDKQAAMLRWAELCRPGGRIFANLDPWDVCQGPDWASARRLEGEQTVLTAPVAWGRFVGARGADRPNRQGVSSRTSLYHPR